MLDHARHFLTLVLPPGALGTTQYYNVHWSSKTADGQKFWDGRACETIDEALKVIQWIGPHPDKDVYVCMSTQAKMETKVSKKGASYRKALRLQQDAVALRSLFIDVDVKEGAYATTRDALAALQKFIGEVGLPIPNAVVASGSGGFHAHWALDQALSPAAWQLLANALAAACLQHGLMTDSQCTIDSARILRVPETFNRKRDPATPVQLLSINAPIPVATMQAALTPYIGQLPSRVTTATRLPDNDDLGAGLTSGPAQEMSIAEVALQCGFVARSIGSGGKDNPNPLWFMTASIATFVENGRDALHLMSNKHPGYTPSQTDELYDRVVKQQKERDLGWPKCSKIAGYGAKECQTCPLFIQGKSPLNFAVKAPVNAPDPTLPDRYSRNSDGLVMFRRVDDAGVVSSEPIIHYPIMNGWLSNNPWELHFTTRAETGKRVEIDIPCEVITAKETLNKYLGGRGFFGTELEYKRLKEFLVPWIQKLQSSKDSVISAAPYGWSVIDGKIEGFAYGGRVWMADGDRPAANPSPVLQYQYSPKGSLKPWKEIAEIVYSQQRPALDAILAVAFAGPLVRFTGHPGVALNTYSAESGIGKTTAMKASLAVWGHATLAMQGLNDTANSVLNKMGHTKALPVYWDEIKTEAQVKRFCSIVFDLTGGREKSRLNSDSQLKMSGTWQTILVSASNESLIDAMAREVGSTTAGLHRMFEYAVPPSVMTRDLGAVQRLVGQLDDNYGHAGMIYSKFLGKNAKRVEAEVARLQDELNMEVKVEQAERNWTATITVVLMGATYANELGLTDINLEALRKFLLEVMAKNRSEVAVSPTDMNTEISVSSILAEFLNATRARNTLITNRIWISPGKPPRTGPQSIKIVNDTSKLSDIQVQYGQDDRLMRISSTYFTRWMGERGYSRHSWTERMRAEYGLQSVNGILGSGTALVGAKEYLIQLDMNHAKLSTLME